MIFTISRKKCPICLPILFIAVRNLSQSLKKIAAQGQNRMNFAYFSRENTRLQKLWYFHEKNLQNCYFRQNFTDENMNLFSIVNLKTCQQFLWQNRQSYGRTAEFGRFIVVIRHSHKSKNHTKSQLWSPPQE